MARYLRKTVILAKIEATYGTDPNPTGAANAMLAFDATITPLQANNVDRALLRGYLGGNPQLVGTASVELSFSIEVAGAGSTATTAPAWAPLVQACGFSGAAATAGYELTPTSTFGANSSVTIYYYVDGQRHKLLGARGTFTIEMGVGERPVFKFRFVGTDGGLLATANAVPTLTGFATPLVVNNTNTTALLLGCTYTGATSVLSGGTSYTGKGLSVDIGNALQFVPLVGSETVEITQREVSGSMSLDLLDSDAATFMTAVKANTTTSLGLTHGTTLGNIVVIHAPAVQRTEYTMEDMNGQLMHAYKLRMLPSGSSGNDEIRIVTR